MLMFMLDVLYLGLVSAVVTAQWRRLWMRWADSTAITLPAFRRCRSESQSCAFCVVPRATLEREHGAGFRAQTAAADPSNASFPIY